MSGFDPRSEGEAYVLTSAAWAVALQEQQQYESDMLLARIFQ